MTSPGITAFAVSTAVGSGKTRAATHYIAHPESSRKNFIYVAPTIRLIEQTAANLREAIRVAGEDRDVSLIHSETMVGTAEPLFLQTLRTINDTPAETGAVVIITTKTFLKALPHFLAPEHWRVIIDEGFSPVEFLPVRLGERAASGLKHFLEVFAVDPEQNHRVLPAAGQDGWVGQMATGGVRVAGDQYASFVPLATAVANPLMRCELVMTPQTEQLLKTRTTPRAELLVACYLTPVWLGSFAEVVFMSALFEQTLLHQFWTRCFGVTFSEHPAFPESRLRNIHVDQGMNVQVGHLLHPEDSSSRNNLDRNYVTAAANETEPGQRVADELVRAAAAHFGDSPFLLQINDRYGYTPKSPLMPANAIRIPTTSHGLNEFQNCDNVAALAMTNPSPEEAAWIRKKTGLDFAATQMAFRLHTIYQAVGRSSIRSKDPTDTPKVFLTAGREDAEMLHDIFEGSLLLGQVGNLRKLAGDRPKVMTTTERIAYDIASFLDEVPPEIDSIPSRSVKEEMGVDVSTSTWTRAVDLSVDLPWNRGWGKQGQSFVRMTAARYGFQEEDGSVDDDVEITNVTIKGRESF